jgi:hypothetical protein
MSGRDGETSMAGLFRDDPRQQHGFVAHGLLKGLARLSAGHASGAAAQRSRLSAASAGGHGHEVGQTARASTPVQMKARRKSA